MASAVSKRMEGMAGACYHHRISAAFWIGSELEVVTLKLIAGILLVTWLVLVLVGKGGFVHILLLNGIGVAVVEMMTMVRSRMTI